MLEISGQYNTAKIFTDVVDQASIGQVIALCSQEFVQGSRIRLMPDVHAGAGCTVGTTMTITDKVVPNLVGVDIGCGMETVRLREDCLELGRLDKVIREKIPSGFAIREKSPHRFAGRIDLEQLRCARHVDLLRAEKSVGPWGAATTSSRWTGMMRAGSTSLSTRAAGIWVSRWPIITRTRAIRR